MGTAPFVPSAKLPLETNTKPPKSAAIPSRGESAAQQPPTNAHLFTQRLSTAERLRRLEEAQAFLRQHLAGGPQPARTLLQAAKVAGIAERTLHRAKDLLGVTTERAGGYAEHGQWIWYPPAGSVVASASAGSRKAASTALRR